MVATSSCLEGLCNVRVRGGEVQQAGTHSLSQMGTECHGCSNGASWDVLDLVDCSLHRAVALFFSPKINRF